MSHVASTAPAGFKNSFRNGLGSAQDVKAELCIALLQRAEHVRSKLSSLLPWLAVLIYDCTVEQIALPSMSSL